MKISNLSLIVCFCISYSGTKLFIEGYILWGISSCIALIVFLIIMYTINKVFKEFEQKLTEIKEKLNEK